MAECEVVWDAVDESTRSWLVDHNGEGLPGPVVRQLLDAAGGGTEPEWLDRSGEDGPMLTDDVVDWIEGVANGE